MAVRILIADDDERWRRIVGDYLRNEGFAIVDASDGAEALALLRSSNDIALVVLDIMMPKVDGVTACKMIRTFSQVPILMVTARTDEESELLGFVCGADEFISKPLKLPVFIARIKALLKRAGEPTDRLRIGVLEISPGAHLVWVAGEEVRLTPRESALLMYLAQNRGVAVSRQQILDTVRGDYYGDMRTVDTHIKNLRMKLGPAGQMLKTVRGRGYMLEEPA